MDRPQLSRSQERFLQALAVHGNVAEAARVSGYSRQVHYDWLKGKANPRAKKLYQEKVQAIGAKFRAT